MKRALLGAGLVAGLLAVAGAASAQVSGYVITKKGSKCITRRNAGGKMTIVGTGCLTDPMNQKVTLDVGSGAMKIFNSCVERRGWDLVLASCNSSNADQKFLLPLPQRRESAVVHRHGEARNGSAQPELPYDDLARRPPHAERR